MMSGTLYTRMRRDGSTAFLHLTAKGRPRTALGAERALKAYKRMLYGRDYDHADAGDLRRYTSRQGVEP